LTQGSQMPSAAAAFARKKPQRETRIEKEEVDDDEDNLEELAAELPPKESWEAELNLGTLVLG
jgi:hypothetical protein